MVVGTTYIQAHKWACHQKNHRKVPSPDVQSRDHDCAPDGRKYDRHDNMPTMLENTTRMPRHRQRDQESNNGWRGLDKIGDNLIKTERCHDLNPEKNWSATRRPLKVWCEVVERPYTRKEVLIRLRYDEGKVDQGEHMGYGVLEHRPDAAPVSSLVIFREAAGRNRLSVRGHLGFFGREEVGSRVAGKIGDEPERGNNNDDAHDSWMREIYAVLA